ncbi:MAG: hypothetical protein ABSG69_10390 [Candidatus Acidiferrum sp.]|jgi:hypothetical protein
MALCGVAGGCKKDAPHTADPRLEHIDALLAKELPPGTPAYRVQAFVNMRGYEVQDSTEPHTLVVIVHHVDLKTLQPEAARVTFRFNADLKLTTYDLQPAPTLPIR